MKSTYSCLVSENPTIYHVWYVKPMLLNDPVLIKQLPISMIITDIENDVSKIQLGQKIAYIDTSNVYILLLDRFHISESRKGDDGYFTSQQGYLHNILMQFDPKSDRTKTVDHLSNKSLDNRMVNLRLVGLSTQIRNRNTKKQPNTGHRGIYKSGNIFDVAFRYNKIRYRAYFKTLEEAIVWRDTKMKEIIPPEELLEWRDLLTE